MLSRIPKHFQQLPLPPVLRHHRYGKWVGLLLGAALLGVPGAVVGLLLGHIADEIVADGLAVDEADIGPPPTPPRTPATTSGQLRQVLGRLPKVALPARPDTTVAAPPPDGLSRAEDFGVSLVVLASAVVRADNDVSRLDMSYIRSWLIQQFGADTTDHYLALLEQLLRQPPFSLQQAAQRAAQTLSAPARWQLIDTLFGLANADYLIDAREVERIRVIAQHMGVANADFYSIQALHLNRATAVFDLLQANPAANDDDLIAAFKRLYLQWHPSWLADWGPNVVQSAERRHQALQLAFRTLCKERLIPYPNEKDFELLHEQLTSTAKKPSSSPPT